VHALIAVGCLSRAERLGKVRISQFEISFKLMNAASMKVALADGVLSQSDVGRQ
jgi:hypothetical protein